MDNKDKEMQTDENVERSGGCVQISSFWKKHWNLSFLNIRGWSQKPSPWKISSTGFITWSQPAMESHLTQIHHHHLRLPHPGLPLDLVGFIPFPPFSSLLSSPGPALQASLLICLWQLCPGGILPIEVSGRKWSMKRREKLGHSFPPSVIDRVFVSSWVSFVDPDRILGLPCWWMTLAPGSGHCSLPLSLQPAEAWSPVPSGLTNSLRFTIFPSHVWATLFQSALYFFLRINSFLYCYINSNVQADLGNNADSVPNHYNKANITRENHTNISVSQCIEKLCLPYSVVH